MVLGKLGLKSAGDLLWYLPRRYEDRRDIPPIMYLRPGRHNTALGKLVQVNSRPLRGGKVLLEATLADQTGELVIQWFNQPWLGRQLEPLRGQQIVAYGLVREGYRGRLEMAATEWEPVEDGDTEEFARIVPVYPLSEGVPQRTVRKAARTVAEALALQVAEPLPLWIRKREGLPELGPSLRQLHVPESDEDRVLARQRLAFDEFLYLQLALQLRRREVKQEVGISFPISRLAEAAPPSSTLFGQETRIGKGGIWDEVLRMLPFQPTRAQERVVHEVWADMERPAPMNRLVQGDVGSGKTAVAAAAMLAAVRCGYQAAMMAPTEILAEQHSYILRRLFDPLGISVALLVGKLKAREKKRATTQTANGEAQICVGTHALIQEGVTFAKLGLAVIDEQHRFGVLQRMALRTKGLAPDVLVMTATPIPRTMTMTVYGDLDLSVIDELPPGRKPIRTHWKRPGGSSSITERSRSP
jgi:ATP-dependent DNA helicase RecG